MESFLAWRKQFEIDMGIPAKREREAKDKNKLTGKELFLRDTTLNESDLKFLDDGMFIIINFLLLFLHWLIPTGHNSSKSNKRNIKISQYSFYFSLVWFPLRS